MFLRNKIFAYASFSLIILGGCATSQPALKGRLDPNLGSAVRANVDAQAVTPSPAQKANTYIPADPIRAALVRKNYRENMAPNPNASTSSTSGGGR